MQRIFLLGFPIDVVTKSDAVARLRSMLRKNAQHHVVTPNSEMLVEATRNGVFRDVLRRSALNLPDSQGLVWMARLMDRHLPERVTGVDTVTELCHQLSDEHGVFLLGAAEGIAARAADVLKKRNPHLRIVGTYAGSPRDEDAGGIVHRINEAKPHLLLVAYGAPAQDLWIDRHLKKMPSVRVAMGVGGTFDFIAGNVRRAPKLFRQLGLEWLWRLMREPRRIGRIVRAVVIFPVLVLAHKKEG